jgi:glycosyltransferase involved in cell wall biosynthesis
VLRLAVLTSHPIQYNAPFFAYLAQKGELDLTVLYCANIGSTDRAPDMSNFGRSVIWDVDLLEGYRWKLLANPVRADPQRRLSMLGVGLLSELRASRYDLVVNYGWAFPADWLSFALSQSRRIPFLLYGDTSIRDEATFLSGPVRYTVRNLVLSALCGRAAGALYTGTFNRDFYIRHRVPPDRLWFSPWSIDSARFRGRPREEMRNRFGLKDDVCYFLFSGSLIARKRPAALVNAIDELQRRGHRAGVLLAGSGALEQELRHDVERLGIADAHFLGFVNQRTMPDVYAAADVLVLPSERDPRATVVNEAMTAGRPVIISSRTGVWGPGDLVQHGRQGFVFDVQDPRLLIDYCERVLDPELRSRMGDAAASRAKWWSFDLAANGWLEAALAVTRPRARHH